MNNEYFPRVETWILPEGALHISLHEMTQDGQEGNEGVALWLGRQIGAIAEVAYVVGLRGPGVIKRADQLRIADWLINEVTDQALELGVSLIGHIHSHGEGYGTDLSPTDRTFGIAVPYYLSVVAPGFGMRSQTQIADCGVHVFEPSFGYRRLPVDELEQRVRVAPGMQATFILAGEE